MPHLAVALALIAAPGLCRADAVAVANPGFELDEDGNGVPDGWRTFASGEGFEFALGADAHSGDRCACITGLPGHGDRACYGQTTARIAVARAYRLSVWVRGAGRATVLFRCRYADANGEDADDTRHVTIESLSAEEWREATFEFPTAGEVLDAREARIELLLYQRGEGPVCFDDVRIQELEEWTPKVSEDQQPTQTPRRPIDGRAVLQNPPDFWWQPQLNADGYELQLSTSEDFGDGTITIRGLPYNCYSHSEVLDASRRWHWRFRYLARGTASEWSEAWHFDVSPDAVEFPVPPPDELLARVPADHPRVYVTREGLQAFRARREGEAAEWWEGFQKRCDTHLELPLPQEPGAEYDFSGRSGPLTAEQKARMDELRGLGSRATGPMWNMAFAYLVGGDERYGQRAVEWLMEIATWDPEGTTGYRNHDQVFRDIAWKSACVYDWTWELMTDEQRAQALDAVVARASILYRDFREDAKPIYEWPFDSHGWTSMGFLGIIACATCHDAAQADDWFRFIAATYPPLYPPWGGEEGGWCQGTAYWKWSVSYFAEFADALRSATGLDLFGKAFCRNNGWFKLYMHPPFCDRHHFGDGNLGSPGITDRNNLLVFATRYGNPYLKWYADQIPGGRDTGVFGYWWYDYDLPARPPADLPQSRYLADIGWVGMHSDLSDPDDIMLMLKSSWYGSFNHSHADQNHFVVYGYGEPLLIDSGYYDWYGSDHDRNWTRQTRAHNNVLVNGEGQPIFDITAKGEVSDYFPTPFACYAAGDASQAYQGRLSRFERHVLYLRPDAFLIVDELEAEEPSTFTWCCHALEQMQIDEADRRITVRQGEAALDIAFAAPEGLAFTQDDGWDGHPPQGRYESKPRQWHCFVETTEPATRLRFVTLMRVRKGGDRPDFAAGAPDSGSGVRGVLGGLTADVRAAGDEPLAIADNVVDADVAAAYRAGESVTFLALGATEISAASAPAGFLTSTAPVTVAQRYDRGDFIRADLRAMRETDVALWVPQGTEGVSLDGDVLDRADARWDAERKILTVTLQPGDHSIVSPKAAPMQGGSFELTIAGRPAELDQELLSRPAGGALLFAEFAARPGPYMLDTEALPDVPVTLNGARLRPDEALLWLREKNALQARLQEPATLELALDPLPLEGEPAVASVLESVPEDAVTIEAEAFVAHGLGKPTRYAHRTFLSGGVGVGEWIVPGMWLQWDITVPEPGRYALVLKGATHEAKADRLIMLDGEPIGGRWRVHRFEYTGGYGAEPGEWRHLMVVGDDGEPVILELTAGAHELRMICIENRLNLDYLMLVPAG